MSLNLLLVDDDHAGLYALSEMLSVLEANQSFAKSGEEALRLVLKHSFDAILLDVRMPRMDGFEVAAAIRKVLDEPLAGILLGLAAGRRSNTEMSAGQATLFWLKQNMPRAADRVLRELRARPSKEA